jgi:hypothetical protein
MTGLAASLREGGFTVDVVRRLPGIYWSEVVRAVV